MVEFSLLELREFISISETIGLSLREFSFVSLRLALQRTCDDFKIVNFLDFVRQFQQNVDVKKALQIRILSHPKELLRDAASWKFVLESNQKLFSNENKSVLIIDNSFGADTVSFFLLCQLYKIHLSCNIHWYSLCRGLQLDNTVLFSLKDIEVAQSNLLDNRVNLTEYFKESGGQYAYNFNGNLKKAENTVSENTMLPLTHKYDLIISQNNSLKFNFMGHELFFRSCLSIANENSGLFFGSRENLKQCNCLNMLVQPKPELNYFIYENR